VSCAHVGDVCEELGHKNLVTWPPKVHPSLTHEFWVNADVNDALEALYKFAPRDFPLEMNGCAYGLCYAPFFGCTYVSRLFVRTIARGFGAQLWVNSLRFLD